MERTIRLTVMGAAFIIRIMMVIADTMMSLSSHALVQAVVTSAVATNYKIQLYAILQKKQYNFL